MGLTRPDWIIGPICEMLGNMIWIWPPSKSFCAMPAPLYGTWVSWILAADTSISTPTCVMLPTPAEP